MNDNIFSTLFAKDHINHMNCSDSFDKSIFLSTEILSQRIPTLNVAVTPNW